MAGESKYDVFISYSHAADRRFAQALQRGLHRFARKPLQVRALRTFRDETNLAATPHLWGEIESALRSSKYFVLLASEASAQSKWVKKEVELWLDEKSSERLLVCRTDGLISWDDNKFEFDWERTTALCAAVDWPPLEPRHVDATWSRAVDRFSLRETRFAGCVADIASAAHDRDKDELVGDDVNQRRKLNAFLAATTALLLLLVAGLSVAVFQLLEAQRIAKAKTSQAEAEKDNAEEAKYRADSERKAADDARGQERKAREEAEEAKEKALQLAKAEASARRLAGRNLARLRRWQSKLLRAQAVELRDSGKRQQAIARFVASAEADPKNRATVAQMGMLLISDSWATPIGLLRRSTTATPGDSHAPALRGGKTVLIDGSEVSVFPPDLLSPVLNYSLQGSSEPGLSVPLNVKMSPDGDYLTVRNKNDGAWSLWQHSDLSRAPKAFEFEQSWQPLEFTPDGAHLLLVNDNDGGLRLFSLNQGTWAGPLVPRTGEGLKYLRPSGDDGIKLVVPASSGSQNFSAAVWLRPHQNPTVVEVPAEGVPLSEEFYIVNGGYGFTIHEKLTEKEIFSSRDDQETSPAMPFKTLPIGQEAVVTIFYDGSYRRFEYLVGAPKGSFEEDYVYDFGKFSLPYDVELDRADLVPHSNVLYAVGQSKSDRLLRVALTFAPPILPFQKDAGSGLILWGEILSYNEDGSVFVRTKHGIERWRLLSPVGRDLGNSELSKSITAERQKSLEVDFLQRENRPNPHSCPRKIDVKIGSKCFEFGGIVRGTTLVLEVDDAEETQSIALFKGTKLLYRRKGVLLAKQSVANKNLVVMTAAREFEIIDPSTGVVQATIAPQETHEFELQELVEDASFSEDGNLLGVVMYGRAGGSRSLEVWSTSEGLFIASVQGVQSIAEAVASAAFSPCSTPAPSWMLDIARAYANGRYVVESDVLQSMSTPAIDYLAKGLSELRFANDACGRWGRTHFGDLITEFAIKERTRGLNGSDTSL